MNQRTVIPGEAREARRGKGTQCASVGERE